MTRVFVQLSFPPNWRQSTMISGSLFIIGFEILNSSFEFLYSNWSFACNYVNSRPCPIDLVLRASLCIEMILAATVLLFGATFFLCKEQLILLDREDFFYPKNKKKNELILLDGEDFNFYLRVGMLDFSLAKWILFLYRQVFIVHLILKTDKLGGRCFFFLGPFTHSRFLWLVLYGHCEGCLVLCF